MDDVIRKIRDKYISEYTLLPPKKMRPLNFRMDPGVPADLQQQIMETAIRSGIFFSEDGMDISLAPCASCKNAYELAVDGKPLFIYPVSPKNTIFFYGDPAAAISWTLYSIAFYRYAEWFSADSSGKADAVRSMVCKCFSARQQGAALRLMKAVETQYSQTIPDNLRNEVSENLCNIMGVLSSRAPRFSGRPISGKIFEKYRTWNDTVSIAEFSSMIFPECPYEAQVKEFCKLVLEGDKCRREEKSASDYLRQIVYDLPIAAVSAFFIDLSAFADGLESASDSHIREMLLERRKISLDSYQEICAPVDDACHRMIIRTLQAEFIRRVISTTRELIRQELNDAWMLLGTLRQKLRFFCYLSDNSFQDQLEPAQLNWKQISQIRDRDLSVCELVWDVHTVGQTQINLVAEEPPRLCLCPRSIVRDDSENAVMSVLTRGIPTTDNQLFWAFWIQDGSMKEDVFDEL